MSNLPSSLRRILQWLAIAGLALAMTLAFAAEHGHAESPAAAAEKPAASAPAKPAEPEAHAPKNELIQNPIDRVRERLAQRLGAVKPAEANGADVVRVVSKASLHAAGDGDLVTTPSAAHVALARHAPRPAARQTAVSPLSGNAPGAARWDYTGSAGPETWSQLKPEFSKCSNGTRQSPIDIREGIRVDLDPVAFDYKASAFKVVDNGHTVQVDLAPGNSIEVMGRRYELVEFHFHRPSEERINGKQYDMVVHLVHRDLDGHLAVIAVLLDRGSALQAVQTVWNNLPLEKGDEVAARTLLDPNDLLPASRSYYTYMGSMTTPPCSEGVLWMVMKTPMPISADQLAIFARLYPMNARPLQASSGRLIKESN